MDDTREVGQFIPLHYHFNMLSDTDRMTAFRAAIRHVVKPGDTVLELGSGTGVLSSFAAEKARKVYSVEYNLELVEESRRLLHLNNCDDKVEVIHGDAFAYLPPEPVNVVICEMLHSGLLREKQAAVIDSFKSRYRQRFGDALPTFIPLATFQAAQPVQYDFTFEGYYAPIILFNEPYRIHPRVTELGMPALYHQLLYEEPYALSCQWNGVIPITAEGTLNALRISTKNILAIVPETERAIDWYNQFLIIPLAHERPVCPGYEIAMGLDYSLGAPLCAFKPDIKVLPHKAV